MKFNELNVSAKKPKRRSGRGIAAGRGKTAGRGTKGQNSRTGGGVRLGFEGGQNPLHKRLPKLRGFKSKRISPEVIYTDQLDSLGVTVDNNSVAKAGLVSSRHVAVKLISRGTVSKKHTVKLQGASQSAIEQVQKASGSFEKTSRQLRPKTSEKRKKEE